MALHLAIPIIVLTVLTVLDRLLERRWVGGIVSKFDLQV